MATSRRSGEDGGSRQTGTGQRTTSLVATRQGACGGARDKTASDVAGYSDQEQTDKRAANAADGNQDQRSREVTLLFPAQQQLEASRYPARLRNSHSVGVIIAEYYSVIDLAYPGGKLGSGRASCSSRSRRKHVTRHGTL